jgi:hypothetical protein
VSTFGKKSLIWWDYENRTKEYAIRFNHTPMDIQLEILTKWFPIGSKCDIYREYRRVNFDNKFNRVITGYTKHTCYFTIRVEVDDYSTGAKFTQVKNINPFNIILHPNDVKKIKRESKLDRLGF